jgi:hypothetical protein
MFKFTDVGNFFSFLGVGCDWVHVIRRPLFGLLCQPRMVDDDECVAVGGMRIGKENRSIRRKPAPVPISITNYTWLDPVLNPGRRGGRWMIILRPLPLYPGGKSPRYPLDSRLGGPQSQSGRREEKILDPTETRTPTPRSSNCYADYAIPVPTGQWTK